MAKLAHTCRFPSASSAPHPCLACDMLLVRRGPLSDNWDPIYSALDGITEAIAAAPQPVKAEQKESDPRQICKRCGAPAGLRGTGRDLCDACWEPYAHGVFKMNKSGGDGNG